MYVCCSCNHEINHEVLLTVIWCVKECSYIYYVIFSPLRGNYVTPRISDYSHAFKSSVR